MVSARVSMAPVVAFVYKLHFERFLECWLFGHALGLTLAEERGGNQRYFFYQNNMLFVFCRNFLTQIGGLG